MANTKSAKKRVRQTVRKTERNTVVKSRVKTAIRAAKETLASNAKESPGKVNNAISLIAKAAKVGTIHKRNASRKISRLMKKAAAMLSPKKA